MKRPKNNYVDSLIDNLTANFSKIKNFHLLQESDEGQRLFNLITKSYSEFETFQSLFLNYFIPASNKSIADSWIQISQSKYKKALNISKHDLKENLYETIRLGYVGLFHKYEAYLKDLIDVVNFVMKDITEKNNLQNVQDYCKTKYGFNIFKSHHKFAITKRINYIANCIKHYDSFPVKQPVHKDFTNADPKIKIKIDQTIFKHDIAMLKSHIELLMSIIMMLTFEQFFNLKFDSIKDSLSPDFANEDLAKLKINELKQNIDTLLQDLKN